MDVTTAVPDGLDRIALWYALLFSVPVGVGVSTATMRASGGGALDPLVVIPGVVTAVGLFLFVLVAARDGTAGR